jgi:hypothetical protein
MLRLLVQQNATEYVGAFARPPFSLWGDGRALLEGLHDTFSGFGVALKDFRIEGTVEDPSSQTVRVYIGSTGQYRFRFDRVEAAITNGSTEDLMLLPSILANGGSWLRATVPDFTFQSHLLSYVAHGALSEQRSEDFLTSLGTPRLPTLGTARGSGVIFHGEDVERSWRFQLTVDHSLVVNDGLFVQIVILMAQDNVDYPAFVLESENILRSSLSAIGLEL